MQRGRGSSERARGDRDKSVDFTLGGFGSAPISYAPSRPLERAKQRCDVIRRSLPGQRRIRAIPLGEGAQSVAALLGPIPTPLLESIQFQEER
uniref:Uncharacterized protein n=1 Tax=Steinernema glaseri TaxID=37863 RepID=A0A1I8A7V5_9BILA